MKHISLNHIYTPTLWNNIETPFSISTALNVFYKQPWKVCVHMQQAQTPKYHK